jgi:hypothetical protein
MSGKIFLLYSQLQASGAVSNETLDLGGLGFVDSRKGELLVRIDVKDPSHKESGAPQAIPSSARTSKRGKAALRKDKQETKTGEPLEIQLFQDTTALRSRKGDTGESS